MLIGIIGHFGGKEKFNDGQTVKTLSVYEALREQKISIEKIDTYYIHKNILRFVGQFIKSLFICRKYIVLLSGNGRRVLFPVLAFMSRFLKKDIFHFAIGGRLADEVESGKQPVSRINSFRANWVESEIIVQRLLDLGVTNVKCVPNFKNITKLTEQELVTNFQEPYRLCTFSRVMREKGITDAVIAVRGVNEELGRMAVKLDIYGPIEDDYREEFALLIAADNSVQYCGIIPANESVRVLKEYYMLLFPTWHRGEGMPGTIIDALFAGVPIIARRWQYCDEMLADGVNGYIYDSDKPELLKDKIVFAITNKRQTIEMRNKCLKSAEKYDGEKVIEQIIIDMGI